MNADAHKLQHACGGQRQVQAWLLTFHLVGGGVFLLLAEPVPGELALELPGIFLSPLTTSLEGHRNRGCTLLCVALHGF